MLATSTPMLQKDAKSNAMHVNSLKLYKNNFLHPSYSIPFLLLPS